MDRRTFLGGAAAVAAGAAVASLSPARAGGATTTATAAGLPLYQRALLGINTPVKDDANPALVNPELHALETDFGVKFPFASVFWTFDTAANPHGHDSILRDFEASGRGLHVCLQPEKFGSTVQMADIANGVHDALLTNLFGYLQAYTGPVVLRFAHEANGNWYRWSPVFEDYKPGLSAYTGIARDSRAATYIAAFRHVATMARQYGIKTGWCASNTDTRDPGPVKITTFPMEALYPGNDYCDYVGADGYNNNTGYSPTVAGSGDWRTFDKCFAVPFTRITNLTKVDPAYSAAFEIPFWIFELGCVEAGATERKGGVVVTKAGWLDDGFRSTTALTAAGRNIPLGVHYFDYGNRNFNTSTAAHDAAAAIYRAAGQRSPLATIGVWGA